MYMIRDRALVMSKKGPYLAPRSPMPGSGRAVVRILMAGICRTDLNVAADTERCQNLMSESILGHEASGVMEETADDELNGYEVGDLVSFLPFLPCGSCQNDVNWRVCSNPAMFGREVDGIFATRVSVHPANLVKITSTRDPYAAAYLEPVAAALAAVPPVMREGGGNVLVLGNGRIATLTSRVLRHFGIRVHDVPSRDKFRCVVETNPTTEILRAAVDSLAPGGTLVLKSRPAAPVIMDVAALIRKNIKVEAVSYGSFDHAAAILGDEFLGLCSPDGGLVGETFALNDWKAAFKAARASENTKIFLSPGG